MTHAVELLLDSESDAAVREHWDLLEHAGLPSRARHGSPSNRPHVTVVGVADVAPEAEQQVARSCVDRLPLEVRLGAPVVFLGVGLPDDRIHAPNEKADVGCLLRGAEAVAYLWEDLAAAHEAARS